MIVYQAHIEGIPYVAVDAGSPGEARERAARFLAECGACGLLRRWWRSGAKVKTIQQVAAASESRRRKGRRATDGY